MFAASKTAKAASAAAATDPQFNYVTMLLHGDGTNGAQNNTFLDSSTNNFTITRNGNTTQGTFSPYGSNWSNYFDGANSALNQSSTTAWNFLHNGSSWTIEFDIFPTTTNLTVLASNVKVTANTGFTLQLNTAVSNDVGFYIFNGSTYTGFTSSANIVINQWNHVGITFETSTKTCTFYINGVQRGSSSNTSFSYPSGNSTYAMSIGCEASSLLYDYTGYLSNFRISNVVRTGMTTVPTAPYTSDANTSLLTCQSNRFIDSSSNAYALTVGGSPSVQRFSPFSPTTAYSTSVIGGSGYFDGSGDYLTVADNNALELLASDFTIECWVYPTGGSGASRDVISKRSAGANYGGYSLYLDPSNNCGFVADSDTSAPWAVAITGTLVTLNQWTHLAATRSGSTWTLWKNGVSAGTATASITINDAVTSVGVGAIGNGDQPFTGYITDARIIKGTAVYTTTFTPPTAPLAAVSGTSLLMNYTNAGILDNAMMNDLETVGNAQISTSVKKYGTGSMYFDGTGDYLYIPSSPNLAFGSGDFTIEFWLYLSALPLVSLFYSVYDNRPASQGAYPLIYVDNTTGTLKYWVNSADRITGSNLSTSTWYHIAISRSSGSTKMFLNGTQTGSTYTDSTVYLQSYLTIGANALNTSLSNLNGYIDDLRITKGYARYTSNFTPPTAAFPNN